MTIKDKRDAVVEAAKAWSAGGIGAAQGLIERINELEAAETPLKLEGVVHTSESGNRMGGVAHVELRGQLTPPANNSACVTLSIHENETVADAFRSIGGDRAFRIVLTEIMDDAS